MKKIILPLTIAIIFFNCKSKTKTPETSNTQTSTTTTSTEKKVERLDPATIDINKPIDAAEANRQIDCWDGKKIEVAGYGFVFYGDSLDTKSGLELTDSMGGTKKLVDCRFENPPSPAKIAKTSMIHIRGKVRSNFDGAITMDSCEIIEVAASIPTQSVDPFAKTVMNANELWADYFKWEGKEIAIIGDYYMTTTSTNTYGKTIRVDIKKPGTYDKVAGCNFKEDPTDKIRVNEKGVIVRGRIKTYTPYGYMMLEDCSVVNR